MIRKKTKIVATIGPSCDGVEMMSKLIKSGVNVFRFNFSHGTYDHHKKLIENAREAIKKEKAIVALLQDLSGPKIRIGDFKEKEVILKEGKKFVLTSEKILGNEKEVYINYPIYKNLKKGNCILLNDGLINLEVLSVLENKVITKIISGGIIKGRRGVNLPGVPLDISSITKKDKEDIKFGLKHKFDFVALSFVKNSEDVLDLKNILKKGNSKSHIVSKIETAEAISNLDNIIKVSDAIMVARGDLAVEIPAERVPMIQKDIINKCNQRGKPVIIATQMLESMIKSPVPTRAEVSDVANAIIDGTDAVMLSAETAVGDYPIQAVKMMHKVAIEVEGEGLERPVIYGQKKGEMDIADSITSSVVIIARNIGANVIVALTTSGFTARMISRHKPKNIILALSYDLDTCNKLALSFACYPIYGRKFEFLDEAFVVIRKFSSENKLVKNGDKVVVSAGAPFNKKGVKTNMLFVETI